MARAAAERVPGVMSASVSVVEHTLIASFDRAMAGTTVILDALSLAGYAASGEPKPVMPPAAPGGLRPDIP